MKHFENYEDVKDLLSKEDIERHEQGIVTTLEMDELVTRDDILKKDIVIMQCMDCNKWTEMKHRDSKTEKLDCSNCGGRAYDSSSMKSVRSYDPLKDNKRRIKVAVKRTHESQSKYKGS